MHDFDDIQKANSPTLDKSTGPASQGIIDSFSLVSAEKYSIAKNGQKTIVTKLLIMNNAFHCLFKQRQPLQFDNFLEKLCENLHKKTFLGTVLLGSNILGPTSCNRCVKRTFQNSTECIFTRSTYSEARQNANNFQIELQEPEKTFLKLGMHWALQAS